MKSEREVPIRRIDNLEDWVLPLLMHGHIAGARSQILEQLNANSRASAIHATRNTYLVFTSLPELSK